MVSYSIALMSTAHIHTKPFIDRLKELGHQPTVIWDDNAERGQRYAAQCGATFQPDLADVLSDHSIDAFVLCGENTTRPAIAQQVIPLGKPTFLEKPFATTSAEAQELLSLINTHNTPVTCGYFQPNTAEMQGVRALIGDNHFGAIRRITYRNAHSGAYGRWFDNPDLAWFVDPDLSAGGALLDLGAHAVHAVRLFFGPITKVFAEINNQTGIYPEVDDEGILLLEFANGIRGRVEANWLHRGGLGGLEIYGDEQALWNTNDGYHFGPNGAESQPVPLQTAIPDRMDRLLALLDGTLDENERQADLAAAVDAVAVIEAAYTSAAKGTWQPVPQLTANL